ncbi:MAG: serine/threonine protein kinase [Acidimicrobiales bacterium]
MGLAELFATTTIDEPLVDFIGRHGRIVRTFGVRQDSRTEIHGIEIDGKRLVVKAAYDPGSVGWLASARRFHATVRHPAIPTILHTIDIGDGGLALVEEWGDGEILHDPYDDTVLDRSNPASPYQRFLALPTTEVARAIQQILDAHVAVVDAGFVAVDLYDGCVLYDFATSTLRLIDLDNYCPGPYVLEVDRQFGSSWYMPPEEFTRGATIDERASVFTIGRMALSYLGCARKGPALRGDFRGSSEQYAIATQACAPDPADRIQLVREFTSAWSATLH